jgi:hypothetical protein
VKRTKSPEDQTPNYPCELGFLEDEDYFASLSESLTRKKSKTDYMRRPSNCSDQAVPEKAEPE